MTTLVWVLPGRRVLVLGLAIVLLPACDSGNVTDTGQVTSLSASSVCIDPEDPEIDPYCLTVSDQALVGDVPQGACVRVVGTLDHALVRIETLERACELPRRGS